MELNLYFVNFRYFFILFSNIMLRQTNTLFVYMYIFTSVILKNVNRDVKFIQVCKDIIFYVSKKLKPTYRISNRRSILQILSINLNSNTEVEQWFRWFKSITIKLLACLKFMYSQQTRRHLTLQSRHRRSDFEQIVIINTYHSYSSFCYPVDAFFQDSGLY